MEKKDPPSVITVANVLINEAHQAGKEIRILQLIKLAYISYGFYLGFGHKEKLFREEIQAWRYGPVVPDLYRKVRHYRHSPITQQIEDSEPPLDAARVEFIKKVYAVYGKFSGSQLTYLTHQKGTPWHLMYAPETRFQIIPDDLIADYYKRFIQEHSKNQ